MMHILLLSMAYLCLLYFHRHILLKSSTGSSVSDVNAGSQLNANNANVQSLLRVQHNVSPLRIPTVHAAHQQHLPQPDLRSGHCRSTGEPAESQDWCHVSQSDQDLRKSVESSGRYRTTLHSSSGYVTLPLRKLLLVMLLPFIWCP